MERRPHTAPLQTRFTEEKRERNKNDDDDDDVEDKEGPRYRDGMMAIAEPHCTARGRSIQGKGPSIKDVHNILGFL